MTEKLFYKIGEVGKITGLAPYVLRFWESEFPPLHPRKNKGNQRVYVKKEIDLVLQLKKLLYQDGLTISGARKQLLKASKAPIIDAQWEQIHKARAGLEEVLHILSGRSADR